LDNPAPEQLNPPQTVPAATFREPITRIAAWWHTVLVLLLLAAWAIIGALRVEKLRTLAITHRRWFYARSMLTEWAVLAIVLFGVWLHKSPFAAVLGERWKSAAQIWRDFKVSVAFWFAAVAILIFLVCNSAQFPMVRALNSYSRTVASRNSCGWACPSARAFARKPSSVDTCSVNSSL